MKRAGRVIFGMQHALKTLADSIYAALARRVSTCLPIRRARTTFELGNFGILPRDLDFAPDTLQLHFLSHLLRHSPTVAWNIPAN
jgi:hypothetical protein